MGQSQIKRCQKSMASSSIFPLRLCHGKKHAIQGLLVNEKITIPNIPNIYYIAYCGGQETSELKWEYLFAPHTITARDRLKRKTGLLISRIFCTVSLAIYCPQTPRLITNPLRDYIKIVTDVYATRQAIPTMEEQGGQCWIVFAGLRLESSAGK